MKREKFKDVDASGRKWRIGRFDSLTGSYITTLILTQMLPMGVDGQIVGDATVPKRSMMDRATFVDIQKECLKIVAELKTVGDTIAPIPVLLPDGRWGVEGLDDDTVTVMTLTVNALVFNIADFFLEDALNTLIKPFSDLSLFSAKK